MSYLNFDTDYFDHFKSKRLRLRLGDKSEIYPLRLWAYCGKYHPEDGAFKNYKDEEIASIAGFVGNPSGMLDALMEFEFLTKTPQGWYKIHQWEEHQGHLIAFKERSKAANQARWDKYRLEKAKKNIPNGSLKDPTRNPPNLTLPNLTKPNLTKPTKLSNVFKVPELDELTAYCQERKNNVNPQAFLDHYQARGWMIGKNKMKDWKAAVRTWERNGYDKPGAGFKNTGTDLERNRRKERLDGLTETY